MKICSKCNQELDESFFAFINKASGSRHYQCDPCRRETAKKSYTKHRDKVISKSTDRNNKSREWFRELKKSLSCCVCGESDSACLDFHHMDPSQKLFEVGMSPARTSKKRMVEEINKCACLCANCHRKYHADRLNAPLVKLDITQSYEV